jgi:hypothetical protein
MSQTEVDSDARLTRKQTAEALSAAGYPIADATLATMASRGGGPLFSKFGPRAIYRWGDALEWAKSRLSRPLSPTAELPATRRRQLPVPRQEQSILTNTVTAKQAKRPSPG